MAQETNVTTLAKSAKLGGEFRSEFIRTDNGFTKNSVTNKDPDAASVIAVTAANVNLSGNINADTEYAFRFNLLDPPRTGGPLYFGYGTHWLNKMIGFSAGKMKVLQGGFDNIDSNYRAHAAGFYSDNLVYAEYDNAFAFHVNVAGRLTLQLLNDKVMAPDAARGLSGWNTTAHPTWVLGWMGSFGPVSPLLNFGSYDNNKSRWIDIGVKAEVSGLLATLDVYQQNNVWKRPDPADPKKNKEVADTATSITLYVAYEVKGLMTPWFYFSTYDNKQADDSKLGLKDAKFNGPGANPADVSTYDFSDNGVVYGVGADFAFWGKGLEPFVALVNRSAKFEDPKKPGEAETRSEMNIKVGVLAEI